MEFSQSILQWYGHNKRVLPWRDNPEPYQVVVSEMMLQQTQVPRVIEKFKEFMEKFPTLSDLAAASRADVIQAWSGLGYNRRALLLQKFAQTIVEQYRGKIPESAEELLNLPGIGPYTAGAIASFAFNKPEPAVDVNVRRIYLRYFRGLDQGLPMGKEDERQLYGLIVKSIPPDRSRDFHNALMDFGSLVCTRNDPSCSACPLQNSCQFYPLYGRQKEKALFVMEKKTEKGVIENGRHVPNRIFRGRIVEFVRKNDGDLINLTDLGKVVKSDYDQNDREWLLSLCLKLQDEELIKYKVINERIKLELHN